MPTEIKVVCPVCKKEIKVLLHKMDRLEKENEVLRKQLKNIDDKRKEVNNSMPDFMRDLFK